MAEGLWSSDAARKISQILRKAGYSAAQFGSHRVSGRYPSKSGYRLEHWPKWKEIEVRFEVGRLDERSLDKQAELEKIKAILEAQDLAITVEIKSSDYIKVAYKDPIQVLKELEAQAGKRE